MCNCAPMMPGAVAVDPVGTIPQIEQTREMLSQRASPQTLQARRLMCQTCIYARRDAGMNVASCAHPRLAHVNLTVHQRRAVAWCPRGRWPQYGGTQAGNVTWAWMRWRGVPMPIRWISSAKGLLLKIIGRSKVNVQLEGCGCVHRLKLVWEGILARRKQVLP
jgi:hypothetical protein